MNTLESEFMEEFKRAEGFCNDAFSCQNGVSKYIDEMKNADGSARLLVPGWDNDLRMLKRLRFVRNKIAHEPGASGCTADDLRNAKDFFARLVNEEDPLAQAEEAKRNQKEKKSTRESGARPIEAGPQKEQDPPPKGCLMALLAFVIAGGIALIVLALVGVI